MLLASESETKRKGKARKDDALSTPGCATVAKPVLMAESAIVMKNVEKTLKRVLRTQGPYGQCLVPGLGQNLAIAYNTAQQRMTANGARLTTMV